MRQHVQAARSEVDRGQQVASLDPLAQAGRGAERQQLVALARCRVVGQHYQPGGGMVGVQPPQLPGGAERAEVDDRDTGLVLADDGLQPADGDVVSDDAQVRRI